MELERESKPRNVSRWALEPALLLLFFGWFLSQSIVENQVLKQTCLYKYQYDSSVCDHLDDQENTIEVEIQPYALNVLMTVTIFNAVFPAILSLFLGPWSDKYGRKKIINGLFLGYTITMGWITIVSYLSEYVAVNSPWNYFFAQLPLMISGGQPTLTTVILCYLTDITDEESRSRRFTIFELILFVGILVGIAGSSFVLELSNATVVFAIPFACIAIGTLINFAFVEESIDDAVKGDKVTTQMKAIFTLNSVKEFYSTCVQRRPFRQRRILLSIGLVVVLTSFTTSGSHTVFYYFVRQGFGWTLQDSTLYMAASMLIAVFGAAIAIIFLKKFFHMTDLSLSTISIISMLLEALIKTFASSPWHLYVASTAAFFKFVAGPMLRSMMSTTVTSREVSKVYSITTAFESISGLGSAPVYKAVYASTLVYFPAAFNLISVGVFAVSFILIVLIAKWQPRINTNKETCITKL